MGNTTVFLCEDTIEGIFTAIYDAWDSRLGHDHVKIQTGKYIPMELFAHYVTVTTDYEKAIKVERSIKEKISEKAYFSVYNVTLTDDEEKADLIYRFLVLGFKMGKSVVDHLVDDHVRRVFELNRAVFHEAHLFTGFVRFTELDKQLLFSKINPKYDIIEQVGIHFADRLPLENWAIYDYRRNKACIHKANQPIYIAEDTSLLLDIEKMLSKDEDDFRKLWKIFFDEIAIKERISTKRQTQTLRKRFRADMIEFN